MIILKKYDGVCSECSSLCHIYENCLTRKRSDQHRAYVTVIP